MTSGHAKPARLESLPPIMTDHPADPDTVFARVPPAPPVRILRWQLGAGRDVLVTCLVAVAWLFAIAPPVRAADETANDKLVLRSETGSGRTTIFGTILNYTGDSITIKTLPRGAVHSYPASRIIGVEPAQTSYHVKGLQAFSAGDITGAQAAFERALKEETREWMRREILSLLVRCAVRQSDYATAGSRFLLLVKSDENTPHFRQIPLCWAAGELEPGLENVARGWLEDSSEPARLMGASFLLKSDQSGSADTARLELNKLAASPDPRIQQLAQMQRLRLRLTNGRPNNIRKGRVGPDELKSWQARIESMPEPLRGGPYYILGQAYLQIGDAERAAAALLWLPLIYDQDYQLAARACLEAADALAKVGQRNQAATLYHEVAHRYRESTFAEQALAKLAGQRASRTKESDTDDTTAVP